MRGDPCIDCNKIAAGIQKRVEARFQSPGSGVSDAQADTLSDAPVETPHGIDPRHIVLIQNKPFVKFSGLLELAHKRGLQELRTAFTYNDADLSLAQSTAVFPFGTFSDVGDACPANTNTKVRASFRRVAATRASARALRLALNIGMCAVEELPDHE